MSLSDLFSDSKQIRLAQIGVYNWGTFSGLHLANIHPEGTVITGDTGAGKSTLVDALQPLWVRPRKANFNAAAAQQEKQDRSLVTYIRGKLKDDEISDQYSQHGCLRAGPVLSGIAAHYHSEEADFTLAALFWIRSASSELSDVHRLYVVADRAIPVADLINRFKTQDLKALKQAFTGDEQVHFYQQGEFDAYHAAALERLQIENPNAPGLLIRALGLKQVTKLGDLIQKFVLDPGETREKAADAVTSFVELERTYAELTDLRDQMAALAGLPEQDSIICQAHEHSVLLERRKAATPVYLAREFTRLWLARNRVHQDRKAQAQAALQEAEAHEQGALRHRDAMNSVYQGLGGGQISDIEATIEKAVARQSKTEVRSREYLALAQQLGLRAEVSSEAHASNVLRAQEQAADETAHEAAVHALGRAQQAKAEAEVQLKGLNEELQSARRRGRSALPDHYARLRDDLERVLQLPSDSLLYMAELIDLKSEHEEWRGAIERALGRKRITLLVPQERRRELLKYINSRNLGHDLYVEGIKRATGAPQFRADGFLSKLQWRDDHPYAHALKTRLADEDLRCVDGPEQCEATPYSMTREGLINAGREQFSKRDRYAVTDPRQWFMGFSNARRVRMLEQSIADMASSLMPLTRALSDASKGLKVVQERKSNLEAIARVAFDDVDVQSIAEELRQLRVRHELLTKPGSDLQKAKKAFDAADDEWKLTHAASREAQHALDREIHDLEAVTEALNRHKENQERSVPQDDLALVLAAVGLLQDADADNETQVFTKHASDVDSEIRANDRKASEARNRATEMISAFTTRWHTIGEQVGSERGKILTYRETVLKEGLERHGERFRMLLNKRVTESITTLQEEIKNEREKILDRIDSINRVMRRTELRKGTFLQLDARLLSIHKNAEFDQMVNRVRQLALTEDDDGRYMALKKVIERLQRHTDPAHADTIEAQQLLDARYQFEFRATELSKDDPTQVRDYWSSSSGKSGGEREIFAGSMIAASLAYVLSPEGSPRPLYSTVFLDEAFSHTSSEFARSVISAFRELKLHLNLLTPHKAVDVARDCARSIVYVKRREDMTSEISHVTWDYLDAWRSERAHVQAEAAQ